MRRTIVLITLFLVVGFELAAQESLDSLILGMRLNQTVRVRLHDGSRVEGAVAAVADAPLALRLAHPESLVPATAIDSLWLRGRATGTGAIVGALPVGAATTAVALGFCEAYSPVDGCDLWGPATLPVILGGFGGGALLGAGVGALIPKWRLKYGRSRARSPLVQGSPHVSLFIKLSF